VKKEPLTGDNDELYGEQDEDEDLLTLVVELDGAKARVDLITMVRLLYFP
jgi:hypothetical protein